MDYSKVDAALVGALSKPLVDQRLPISVRTLKPLDSKQQAELRKLGVQGVKARSSIFSATVSPQMVAQLTEKPWVRMLSLARQLAPLS